MKGKIRKVNKKDLLRCQDIIYECSYVGEKNQDKIWSLRKQYTLDNLNKYLKRSDFFCFVFKGGVIGICRLDKNEICTIYVLPKYHRKGVGTQLVQKIEKLAKEKKLKKIHLCAREYAIGFYKKLGYSMMDKRENKMKKELK